MLRNHVTPFKLKADGKYQLFNNVILHSGHPYILVTDSPYFYLSLVLMLLGSQLFLAGFVGELVVRNSPKRNEYEIKEIIGED